MHLSAKPVIVNRVCRRLNFVVRWAALVMAGIGGTGTAGAQCTLVLDPGYTTGSFTFVQNPVHAQTFTPQLSGTVCEILHGVDTRGGMTAYHLYVVSAPGAGPPPTNYTTTNLFAALNQTSFNTLGAGGIDGKVVTGSSFSVTAGQRYALIIVPVGGQMAWRGNNGNPYPNGQGYLRSGASWVASTPSDFTFRIKGLPPPPQNNNCANCIPIGQGAVAGTNVGSTTDGADSCAGGANDVWYCFTAQCSGQVILDTCNTNFDTVLSVHTACPGVVGNEIACNDDCPGSPCASQGSCIAFNAVCGTTYRIRVAGFGGAVGNFVLNLTQAAPSPPANDNCANATSIGNVTNLPFSTCGATTDGPAGCAANRDIWYLYTPNCHGTVRVDTCGSFFDSYLAVYTGTCGALSLVAGTCNDDNGPVCAGLSASVQFVGNPCTTYYIRVGGYGGSSGCGDLSISCSTAVAANDQCVNAIAIAPGITQGTTIGATPSLAGSLVPGPCGASGATRDVWYTYTPPCNGTMRLDTCPAPCIGARYDTVLSVYTGNCPGPLFQVGGSAGCNDDASCASTGCGASPSSYPFGSRITVPVTGGVPYKIRVSGYAGGFGNFGLCLTFTQPPLTNDAPCNAIAVGTGSTSFSTCGATTSAEPSSCPLFNDVWYRYTMPNCSGPVSFQTCLTPFNTVLTVYSGTCAGLVQVACNDDAPVASPCSGTFQSYVSFAGTANTTYYIRVGAATNGTFGNGVLTIIAPPALPTCPPTTGLASSAMYSVMGSASGAPWAFRITMGCCFDLYVPNVPGVLTTGTQSTDEANLRNAFVAAINSACPGLATAYPYNGITSLNYGTFSVKARCGPSLPITFAVGPANTPASALCVVLPGNLPTMGPCSFNPELVQEELLGVDCNANGDDDLLDILAGTSLDANGNAIPDECEFPPCIGDSDSDRDVDFADLTDVLANFGVEYGPTKTGPGDADFNSIVNFADVTTVLANFSGPCP